MSNLNDYQTEQDRITAECEVGECDHPECRDDNGPAWHEVCEELASGGAVHDDSNSARAARVLRVIYPGYDDDTLQAGLQDALCDLRHLCDLMGFDLAEMDKAAHRTYQQELAECGGVAQHDGLKAAVIRDLL